jgi:hypothetical protein
MGKTPNNTQGVIIFKDFSSIMSKRPEARAEIMSQMREIWDGSYSPGKGTRTMDWSGKVTVIAAVTPAIERAWAVQRELGERFVQVRWPREDGVETALSAGRQLDEPKITERFQEKIKEFVSHETLGRTPVDLPDAHRFVYLAEIAAILRGHVVRDPNSRTIIELPQCEAPTRLVKAMMQVAMGSAALYRRDEVGEDDIRLAYRIGVDSIPLSRLSVVKAIRNRAVPAEIVETTGFQFSSVEWITDELASLGVISKSELGFMEYTKHFNELWQQAFRSEKVVDIRKAAL